jgi:protein tyrosine/serine phosphatase
MRARVLGLLLPVAFACAPAAPARSVRVASTESTRPAGSSPSPSWRPAHWAQPLERPGVANLHQVEPDLYRGAQPDARGMKSLSEMGVHTVLNLRSLHSDRDEIGELPLRYEHLPTVAWHTSDDDVIRFLRIATDPERRPLFVHCQHGADRTGMMMAIYRIVVQGWSKDDAIQEMTEGGFGYHSLWHNLVSHVQDLDVERIRRELGPLPARR